ncbi:hypothetical protein OJ998_33255 [Solirubrobacter taibaiensis]|nr:hypothetical protein [Solirubrobacter taibaiensis]
MARSLPPLIVALGALALAPAAHAHSLVRTSNGEVAYLSEDAVSLNTLAVKRNGANIDLRDPTVAEGLDPGSCAPGEVTSDANAWLIQALCPAGNAQRLRIDLGDREDSVVVQVDIPTTVLGGTGADKLTTAGGADAITGDDGDDVIVTAAGADQVNAGDGDDDVDGGAGNDVIEAGLGVDTIGGGDGDDDLRVRDGIADTVRCGPGTDKVEADTLDDIASDCEAVTRLPTAVPPGGGTTGRDRTPPRVRVGGATIQRAGKGYTAKLVATSSERGTIAASGFMEIGDLSLPISTSRQRVGVGGGGVELTFKLNARERREAAKAWKRKRKVILRLGVVGVDRAGNSTQVKAPKIQLLR